VASGYLVWGDVGLDVYGDEDAPRPGGCALNVALALVAAGVPPTDVAVAAPVGGDGAHLRGLLGARGVDVSLLRVLAGPSPRQHIDVEPSGERRFRGYEGGVLTGWGADAALRAALGDAALVYVPVFGLTRPWAELALAVRPDEPVALDLMDLEDLDAAFVEDAVRRAAVVFCGLDARRQAESIPRLAEAARAGGTLLVVTLGPEGAVAFDGPAEHRVPAAPVPGGRVVDTTGCGDALAGTFLARRDAGDDVPTALAAASAAAARVAAHRGAVPT